jgi:hypothetical protein
MGGMMGGGGGNAAGNPVGMEFGGPPNADVGGQTSTDLYNTNAMNTGDQPASYAPATADYAQTPAATSLQQAEASGAPPASPGGQPPGGGGTGSQTGSAIAGILHALTGIGSAQASGVPRAGGPAEGDTTRSAGWFQAPSGQRDQYGNTYTSEPGYQGMPTHPLPPGGGGGGGPAPERAGARAPAAPPSPSYAPTSPPTPSPQQSKDVPLPRARPPQADQPAQPPVTAQPEKPGDIPPGEAATFQERFGNWVQTPTGEAGPAPPSQPAQPAPPAQPAQPAPVSPQSGAAPGNTTDRVGPGGWLASPNSPIGRILWDARNPIHQFLVQLGVLPPDRKPGQLGQGPNSLYTGNLPLGARPSDALPARGPTSPPTGPGTAVSTTREPAPTEKRLIPGATTAPGATSTAPLPPVTSTRSRTPPPSTPTRPDVPPFRRPQGQPPPQAPQPRQDQPQSQQGRQPSYAEWLRARNLKPNDRNMVRYSREFGNFHGLQNREWLPERAPAGGDPDRAGKRGNTPSVAPPDPGPAPKSVRTIPYRTEPSPATFRERFDPNYQRPSGAPFTQPSPLPTGDPSKRWTNERGERLNAPGQSSYRATPGQGTTTPEQRQEYRRQQANPAGRTVPPGDEILNYAPNYGPSAPGGPMREAPLPISPEQPSYPPAGPPQFFRSPGSPTQPRPQNPNNRYARAQIDQMLRQLVPGYHQAQVVQRLRQSLTGGGRPGSIPS